MEVRARQHAGCPEAAALDPNEGGVVLEVGDARTAARPHDSMPLSQRTLAVAVRLVVACGRIVRHGHQGRGVHGQWFDSLPQVNRESAKSPSQQSDGDSDEGEVIPDAG